MGSLTVGSSDWEEQLRGNSCISKRPKTPKKFSDEFVTVDYALVPRKLRSVKKRSSGSISSHWLICNKHKGVSNGDQLSRKNGKKKIKLSTGVSVRQWNHGFGSTITKDEEEVAETLYALADMVPETAEDKSRRTGEPSKYESEAFSNMEISDSGPKGVLEKEIETRTCSSTGTKTNSQSSNVEGSANVKNSPVELPQQSNIEFGKNSGKALASASVRGYNELLHSQRENTNYGSSLSPGLTLKKSLHSETNRPLSQSSTSKFSAISRPQLWENSVTPKKGVQSQVSLRKPWKKCCTHVHISNLIDELKKADALQMESTQSAHFELNRGAFVTSNTLTESTKNVYPLASTSNAVSSATDPNSDEISNAVLLHKRLLQDQKHTAPSSQFFTFQNQNFYFFPLPAGGVGENSHAIAKVDQRAGTVAQLHLPYLYSKNQHTIPFHLPANYYSSTPTGRGTAASQQVQLPSSRGSSNFLQATAITAKQQAWQTQQQQNWCDQLTEHCKAGRIYGSNIPNWQNGVQDGPSLLQFAPFFSSSHSPLPLLSQNYTLRQQQQPSTVFPLSYQPSREQGQSHLHYGLQGTGGCHPDTVQPALQLLCNQQL